VNGSSNYNAVVVVKSGYMLESPYRGSLISGRTVAVSGGTIYTKFMVKIRPVRTISRKGLKRVSESLGYYLAGFVDGEGSFNVSLRKKSDYKVGWQVVLSFNVSQKDPTILKLLRKVLSCGIIKRRKRDGLFSFDVTSARDIKNKIIPFFGKFPFLSEKTRRNFEIFSQISTLVFYGEHRHKKGLEKILKLREELNLGKGRKRKYEIHHVLNSFKESPETKGLSSCLEKIGRSRIRPG